LQADREAGDEFQEQAAALWNNLRLRAPCSQEKQMPKEGIHPTYENIQVKCACGNVFETRSTKGDIVVEICAQCHPFFTGKQKLVDTAGRVERFRRKVANAAKPAVTK